MYGEIIKNITYRDLGHIHALFHHTPANWSQKSLSSTLTQPTTHGLMMTLKQKCLGFVLAQLVDETAEILMVIVEPKNRKKKIGTKLLEALEKIFYKKGIKEVFLEVSKNNPIGQSFYNSLGFKQISTRKNYYTEEGISYDACILKKIL